METKPIPSHYAKLIGLFLFILSIFTISIWLHESNSLKKSIVAVTAFRDYKSLNLDTGGRALLVSNLIESGNQYKIISFSISENGTIRYQKTFEDSWIYLPLVQTVGLEKYVVNILFSRSSFFLLLSISFMCALLIYTILNLRNEKLSILLQNAADATISKTTQMLAHDVRRPLTLVKIGLEKLQSTTSSTEKEALAESLHSSVNQAMLEVDGLIADVLHLGSTTEICRRDVNLFKIVKATIKSINSIYPKRDVNIVININQNISIECDENRISRVLSNIIVNAIEAIPDHATITVSAEYTTQSVLVKVHNTDSYIPPKLRKTIFNSFETHGKKYGTGLGLAIVKKILTLHSSKPQCFSCKETGTTIQFSISGKYLKKSNFPPATVDKELPSVNKVSVAIVDDDPFILEIYKSNNKDYEFHRFLRPEDFLESNLIGNGINLLVTDMHFGASSSMTGVDLAKKVRSLGLDCKIMLASDSPLLDAIFDGRVEKGSSSFELI